MTAKKSLAQPEVEKGLEAFRTGQGQKGEMKLRFEVKDHKTIIADRYHTNTLKICKPFYLEKETGRVRILQMSIGGGILRGDHLYYEYDLGIGSKVLVTSQSSTKVYKTPFGKSEQVVHFRLAENSELEYITYPTIPYAESNFKSEMTIDLHKGCKAFLTEIVSPGRLTMGESFVYLSYQSMVKAYWEGQLILWDNWKLTPQTMNVNDLGLFEGYTHYGNIFILSDSDCINQNMASKIHEKLTERSEIIGGASIIGKQKGIIVRMLGTMAMHLEDTINIIWDMVRRELMGLPKPDIRQY